MLGAWVQFLVGEVSSHMLCGTLKKKKKNKNKYIYTTIKKYKMLRNKFNQGGERLVQWKLQNTALT